MNICGIDPGGSGGIAFVNGERAEAFKMPDTERDVCDLLASKTIDIVYMEAVHAMPPKMPGNTSVASFTFGRNYGFLRGVLVGLKIPFVDVSPQKWKKVLGLIFSASDSKQDKKNGSKQLAQQWFPHLKITHATAEALLIARYGARLEEKNEPAKLSPVEEINETTQREISKAKVGEIFNSDIFKA